ncbi:hypothetical protein TMA_120 [Thermus phage TMA]|uniref:hypothetical protein n=1 Tax=Thermus phage TMA TaxID=699370 RepID=UPI00021AADE8|nr:hypothetical protein TMA_120 [Thermus phage TMA]BAK53808.1 hypothetical protein TMA_120 [Thermus phage TMA]
MKFELFVKEEMPYKITRVSLYFCIEKEVSYGISYSRKLVRKEKLMFTPNKKKFRKDKEDLLFINSTKALELRKYFFNALELFNIEHYDFKVFAFYEDPNLKAFLKQNHKLSKLEESKEILKSFSSLAIKEALKLNLNNFILTSGKDLYVDIDEFSLVFSFNTSLKYKFLSVF